jgi:transposase
MIYVGMDIHKQTTTYCAIDQQGEVAQRGKVSSGEAGWLKIVGQWPVEEVRVALETGGMSWWVVDVLRGAGLEPTVVDARRFKLIADSKKKSDRRDARTLADALKGGLAENCSVAVPSERARRARSLMRTRQLVVKQAGATIRAARSLLGSIGVSITKSDWAKETQWEKVLDNPSLPIWMKPLLLVYRNVWESLERERRDLDAMVAIEQSRWPEAELLRQIPGYGPLVTLAVLSSLDDPHRFKHSGQVASYAGLAPSCRDSGGHQKRGGITHQGRPLLRYLLVQAAWAALRSNKLTPKLRKWTRRLIIKRGTKVAVVALARRLFILGYQLWKNGEAYNPAYPESEVATA